MIGIVVIALFALFNFLLDVRQNMETGAAIRRHLEHLAQVSPDAKTHVQ